MRFILPNCNADAELKAHPDIPLYMLLGPGESGEWPASLALALHLAMQESGRFKMNDCFVAVPSRHMMVKEWTRFVERPVGTAAAFGRPRAWKQHYYEKAFTHRHGCVVVWLPEESKTARRANASRNDIYGDLGYFRGLLRYNRALPLVMGGHLSFPGIEEIRRDYDKTCGGSFPFHGSPRAIATAAVAKC